MNRIIDLYKESFSGLSREVWLLTAVMFVNRCGTMVVTFLALYLKQEKGFSIAEAGLVLSFFGMGSVLGTYIGGWLTDRIGYHSVMFWSFVLGGISFFFVIPLENLSAICIGIFIVSTINDSLRPANLAAVGIYSTEETQTRSLSLIRLAFNMGIAIGPAVGGIIAIKLGYASLFILDGITCILAGILFYFLLPKRPKGEILRKEKIETLGRVPSSKSAYQDVFFLKFIFFVFLNMIVFMHLFTILQVYHKDHFLLNEFQIGLLLGANGLIIGILEMPMVYVLEKKYPIFNLIIVGGFLIGFSFWIFPILDFWTGVVILSMLAITIGEIINFPFMNTIALNRAAPDRRGQYMGLYGMAFSLALVIAPYMGGTIAEQFGFNTLWLILGGINLISLGGFFYIRKLYRKENQKRIPSQQKELVLES